ncbi:MAG: YabP/YqfC family sporulation protein [Lachnospiraceae bacterium]|nr:YabP/YqfC family sporulation protein [Lachnospiraceae bacterium]
MKNASEGHIVSDDKPESGNRKVRKKKGKAIKVSRVPLREGKIEDTMSALSIPDEVLGKGTLMTVLGQRELTVDGHGGILAYETECIRIRTGRAIVSVGGKHLVIDYYNDEELKIVGFIDQISWENR